MGFKQLINKRNVTIFTMLVLVILLSQSRFFDFLTETPIGRLVLLATIIFIAHTNKILGLLTVLAVIIAFSQHTNMVRAYNFYEGFDGSMNMNIQDLSGNLAADLAAAKQSIQADVATTTSSSTASTTGTETFKGREGFCMSDRETNLLRGKQSNTIKVSQARTQNDDVSPSDMSVFSGSYTSV